MLVVAFLDSKYNLYHMKNNISFIICVLLWGSFLLVLLKSSLPYNPIPISKSLQMNVHSLAPEGWAFFTRNPREPSLNLYHLNEQKEIVPYCSYPSAHPDYWMGAKRDLRSIGAEMGAMITQVPDSIWVAQEGQLISFLEANHQNLKTFSIDNEVQGPFICGDLFLVQKSPIPWAWAKSADRIDHQFKIAKIEVTCL